MVTVLTKRETKAMLAEHHLLEWELPCEMINVKVNEGEAYGIIYHNGIRKDKATDIIVYLCRRFGTTGYVEREIAAYILVNYGWADLHFRRTSITNPKLYHFMMDENKKILGVDSRAQAELDNLNKK